VPITERSHRIVERLRAFGYTDAEQLIEEALVAFYEQAQEDQYSAHLARKTPSDERFTMLALQVQK